jgi:D-beta-D-heptose 7-phosphate kinase/D-beta-D-heptose 1-phosphate adenosyltransferase
MPNYRQIINRFHQKKILVIGDLILDQYIRGTVARISPEAPVPIVLQEESFYNPGGSANVANNLVSLGAEVTLVGRIGSDPEAKILQRELKKKRINTAGIFIDKAYPTILKTRVIAQHQQVVRIDREKLDQKQTDGVHHKIMKYLEKEINQYDAVILSDYGKGLITAELVPFICSLAFKKKKIITVDPKVEHFSYYRNVTAITPNLKEAENAIRNIKITSDAPHMLNIHTEKLTSTEDIDRAGKALLDYLKLESLLLTLGEHGMRLFEKGKKAVVIKTKAKDVYDVTGAGDTVISVFTLALTAGASKHYAADLANSAAGVVVGKLGAVAVTKDELIEAVSHG